MATIIVLCSVITQQPVNKCPVGAWYVNGVKPTGKYGCRMRPIRDSRLRTEDPDGTPEIEIFKQIHCTSGMKAIVIDFNTVGCSR
jgi:hypothetical protein